MEKIKEYVKEKADIVNSQDFLRVKKMMVGSFISRFNNIEGLGNFIKDYFIRGVNPFDYYEILKDINEDEVAKRLQYLSNDDRWCISIID